MLFEQGGQTQIPCAPLQHRAGNHVVALRFFKHPHLKIGLILVNLNQHFAESPFAAVLNLGPQAFDLFGRSNVAAQQQVCDKFVHVGNKQVKLAENEPVFDFLFGFKHNPGNQIGIVLIFFHLLKQRKHIVGKRAAAQILVDEAENHPQNQNRQQNKRQINRNVRNAERAESDAAEMVVDVGGGKYQPGEGREDRNKESKRQHVLFSSEV